MKNLKPKVKAVFQAAVSFSVLLMLDSPAPAQIAPAQAVQPPEMHFADASRGRELSKDPSVVFFKGQYYLYYSLGPWVNGARPPGGLAADMWTIGIASSSDLTHWEKVGELLPGGDYEKKGLAAPGARVLNGQVHLFYQTYGNGPDDAICHATSSDGIHFSRDASNPIFKPSGSWTAGRAIDAEVFPVGDRLMLYFATRDVAYKIQKIGVASAPLNSDFARDKWQLASIGSILSPELDWERNCLEAPTITRRDGHLWMFYAGAYNNEPQQIGVATSTDGLGWRRFSAAPLLANGAPGTWNQSESGHPGVFEDPQTGRTWLFFQGNADGGQTWYLSKIEVFWRDGQPHLAAMK